MAALTISLQPSSLLSVILGFAHFFAACLLWLLMLPVIVKLLGQIIVVASLVFYLRRYALLKSPQSVVALHLSEAMACVLETRSDKHLPCRILGTTFVAPYLVVLNLKLPKKIIERSVVILPDSIDAEEFRQLRVLLRWKWKAKKISPEHTY